MGQAAGYASRFLLKRAFNGLRTKSNVSRVPNRASASTTTFQKDMARQYTRKRMPARKRKPWVKFVKKVKAVEATGRGTQQAIINDAFEAAVPTGVQASGYRLQGISEVNLYSVNASSSGGHDKDIILNEVSNFKTLKSTVASTTTTGMEQPLFGQDELTRRNVGMKSAYIDITYTNNGANPLEVDLYTIKHRTVIHDGILSLENAQDVYNTFDAANLYNESAGAPVTAGVKVALAARGVTPFQTPGLNKYAGTTILNKTKVQISSGQSITRRYSDNRHRYIRSHATGNLSRYDKDTTTYLAIYKPRVEDGATSSMQTSFTKVYTWTVEGQNNPRASYFNSNV